MYRNHHSRKLAKEVCSVLVLASIASATLLHPFFAMLAQCAAALFWIWIEEL